MAVGAIGPSLLVRDFPLGHIVRVRVTLQLTVSMSWCRAQSGIFYQRSFFFKVTVLSFGGALSDERSGQSFVSPLSIQSKIVSVFTYKICNDIYIICVRNFCYIQYIQTIKIYKYIYKASVSSGPVQQIML
jgi:hypothetical protein